ncbi:hypothetical protein CW702_02165 [Candidatus Bathyarchaeota archaeon]|nr:MAG: hypothetical protein CW702_02165 [Candidatus Bathyarchaeota archaeon]
MADINVLALTDLHGRLGAAQELAYKAEEENVDVIIICGDITHFGTSQDAKTILSQFTPLRKPVLFVPGNCDPPSLVAVEVDGAECVHGSCRTFSGVAFIGVGGSPKTPFHTPFELEEHVILELLEKGLEEAPEENKLFIISHSPPKDTSVDLTWFKVHGGSVSVRKFVEERKPSILVCGHIHEARGKERIGETTVVNPGPAKDGYYAIINIDEDINVNLESL